MFEGSAAHERAKKLGETRVVTARGADDEAELIKRIGRARVAVNIRAHARFTDGVFAACRELKLVSVWGTGTDNIDLEAAGRRGVTVCNTPGRQRLRGGRARHRAHADRRPARSRASTARCAAARGRARC